MEAESLCQLSLGDRATEDHRDRGVIRARSKSRGKYSEWRDFTGLLISRLGGSDRAVSGRSTGRGATDPELMIGHSEPSLTVCRTPGRCRTSHPSLWSL